MTASSQIEAENLTPLNTTVASDRMGIQTVEFKDHNSDWVAQIPTTIDQTRLVASTPEVPLKDFFSRPRQIWKNTWSGSNSATQTAFVLNPWTEYFNSPNVKAKLQSFAQMRCKMKVKVVINGNGFLYGCKAVYYHPMTWLDVNAGYGELTETGDNLTMDFRTKDFVRHSQKLHGFLIPSESQGCTLELPFLWHKNWVDTTNGEIAYMGNLIFVTLNNLTFLTTGTEPEVEYAVFAWCEDMELSLVTDKTINIGDTGASQPWPRQPIAPKNSTPEIAVSQAGYTDEYGKGPVSKMANSCALASHSLSKVPVIGPYASATASVFGALGSLASLFGFSRPAIIKDISPYKPMYLGNMANTDAGDSCQKLSMDSKQEVTVDPRVVGIDGIDEMTIASIAGRESFFRTIAWQADYAQEERVGVIAVNPMTCRFQMDSGVKQHVRKLDMSGCAYASLPFGAWRGTMRYRFQIIASQFHRGRLAIVWDPRELTEELVSGNQSKAIDVHNYFKVVDLADCRDFTIDVGWGQPTSFLPTLVRPGAGTWDEDFIYVPNDGDITKINVLNSNGLLGIYVLNPLVATNNAGTTGNGVEINVYTSCPDLEVANPICNVMNRYAFQPPAFENKPTEPVEAAPSEVAVSHAGFDESTQQDHAPNRGTVHWHIGPELKTHDAETQYVFYGDPVVSLRALMKRYSFHVAYPLTTKGQPQSNGTVINKFSLPDYPIPPGRVAHNSRPPSIATTDNAGTTVGLFGWSFSMNSFLTFYSPAFLCRRGSIRWKYYTQRSAQYPAQADTHSVGCPPVMTIARGAYPQNTFDVNLIASDGTNENGYTTGREFHTNLPDGIGGQCVTSTENQPVLEIELPFYNYYRFAPTQEFADFVDVNAGNTTLLANEAPHHSLCVSLTGEKGQGSTLLSYVAAGDDYSLSMYLGPPLMYYTDYMKHIKPVDSSPFTKLPA